MSQDGRVTHSESLGALAAAMVKAQGAFNAIGKDKSAEVYSKRTGSSFSYSYADLATCLEAVRPALTAAGLALFQPTRVEYTLGEDASAIVVATTLLVHESGEWIQSDYSTPATDPMDARSVGSAATYARRYGLMAMLGVAPEAEDDDGEQARGGQHEQQPKGQSHGAVNKCPVCGKPAIIKGKEEYGGGWLCFAKRGGCGTKWPEGPFPTAAPPIDPTPTEKVVAIGAKAPYAKRQGSLIDTDSGEVMSEEQARGRMIANLMAWPVRLKWDKAKRDEIKVRHFGQADVNLHAVPLSELEKLHAEVYEAAIAAGIESEPGIPL